MASNRKVILGYLISTTLKIIDSNSGFNTTPQTIARGIKEIDAIPDSSFPALYLARTKEDRENITRNQFRSSLTVYILGIVKNASGTSGLQDEIENLIEDVTKAIETDRTLGGNCKWLEIRGIETIDDDYMPFGTFMMEVQITYADTGTSP